MDCWSWRFGSSSSSLVLWLWRIPEHWQGTRTTSSRRCEKIFLYATWRVHGSVNVEFKFFLCVQYSLQTYQKLLNERGNYLRSRHLQYLLTFSYWPTIDAREGENIYEIRSYTLKPGTIIEWGNNWARAINFRRNNNEPFAGFFSQIGRLYNVHHFWCKSRSAIGLVKSRFIYSSSSGYKDLQTRKETRESAWRSPGWDECVAYTVPLIREHHSRILKPTSYSPTKWLSPLCKHRD